MLVSVHQRERFCWNQQKTAATKTNLMRTVGLDIKSQVVKPKMKAKNWSAGRNCSLVIFSYILKWQPMVTPQIGLWAAVLKVFMKAEVTIFWGAGGGVWLRARPLHVHLPANCAYSIRWFYFTSNGTIIYKMNEINIMLLLKTWKQRLWLELQLQRLYSLSINLSNDHSTKYTEPSRTQIQNLCAPKNINIGINHWDHYQQSSMKLPSITITHLCPIKDTHE